LHAHINGYFQKINSTLQAFYPIAKDYFDYLKDTMGFSIDEASEDTFKVFLKPLEQFIEIYYDLFEIEHYIYLLKHTHLVVGDKVTNTSVASQIAQTIQQAAGAQPAGQQPAVSSGQVV
jgi:hypothetical protein